MSASGGTKRTYRDVCYLVAFRSFSTDSAGIVGWLMSALSTDETKRAPAGRRQQPQGSPCAQSWLWLRVARRRGGPAEGQTYRQCAEDHSHRAVQGPEGPPRPAVLRTLQY